MAVLLGRDRPRPIRAGHAPRRPLSHHRTRRARRDGRGVPRRRSEARATGRAQVPAARRGSRSGAADATPHRSPHGAAGVASERLPRLRHRRDRRRDVPVDGVRRRRGHRVAAPAHRPLPRGSRRSRSRVRSAPAWPRRTSATSSTAISSPPTSCSTATGKVRITDFGLAGAVGRSASGRHARLHGAGAARGRRRHGAKRHLLARAGALRNLHRSARARGKEPRRTDPQARAVGHSRRQRPSSRRSIRRSSSRSCAA